VSLFSVAARPVTLCEQQADGEGKPRPATELLHEIFRVSCLRIQLVSCAQRSDRVRIIRFRVVLVTMSSFFRRQTTFNTSTSHFARNTGERSLIVNV
jgi:hypothetical protein